MVLLGSNYLKKGNVQMSNQKTTLTEFYVTHQGKWVIDEKSNLYIECYVTNDAQRILSLRGTARAMDLRGGGSTALARNLKSLWIKPYLTDGLKKWLDDVENNNITKVNGKQGPSFIPFEASLFVDVCNAYVQAKNDGVFLPFSQWETQSKIADKLLKVMSAFAKIGIVAIIDEVTGYQEERERDELQKLLAKYVREEFLQWTRRFPNEFYKEMFRLRGWEYRGSPKPPLVGKITNFLVYEQLPQGVLDELQMKNPVVIKGYRRYRHHQFLTEETGIPHLDKHLASVVTLMKAFDNWKDFEAAFQRVFGLSSQENLNFASKKKKQR